MMQPGTCVVNRRGENFFEVRRKTGNMATQTTVQNGTVTQRTAPVREIIPGYNPNIFDARYIGDDEWYVDLDCGAMRWRGPKSTSDVRKALRNCGFTLKEANAIIRTYRVASE